MARILVIDDEVELLDVVRDVLTRAQHEVVLASEPDEGLARYREHQPDLVITDIFMPHIGGLVVIMQLAKEAAVKIIAMSGGGARGMVEVLDDAPAFGASRVLRKPFSRAELLAAVNEALAS